VSQQAAFVAVCQIENSCQLRSEKLNNNNKLEIITEIDGFARFAPPGSDPQALPGIPGASTAMPPSGRAAT